MSTCNTTFTETFNVHVPINIPIPDSDLFIQTRDPMMQHPPPPYEVRVVLAANGSTTFAGYVHGEPVTPPPFTERDGIQSDQLNVLLDLMDHGHSLGYDVESAMSYPEIPDPDASTYGELSTPIPLPRVIEPYLDESDEDFLRSDSGVFMNGRRMAPSQWYTSGSSTSVESSPVTHVPDTPDQQRSTRRRLTY
jgi:hypothetical protein